MSASVSMLPQRRIDQLPGYHPLELEMAMTPLANASEEHFRRELALEIFSWASTFMLTALERRFSPDCWVIVMQVDQIPHVITVDA